jgi:hypothetical protein
VVKIGSEVEKPLGFVIEPAHRGATLQTVQRDNVYEAPFGIFEHRNLHFGRDMPLGISMAQKRAEAPLSGGAPAISSKPEFA